MARAHRLLAATLAVALAAALSACAGAPRGAPATAVSASANTAAATHGAAESDALPAAARTPVDPSFDWRRLPLAPLGTPFISLNPLVHEVLLFRDASPQADDHEDSERAEARDCYGPNGAAPRFIGRPTENYLLCFHDDRLRRVQAAVRFDAVDDEPVRLFARLCSDWLSGADPEVESPARCAGRDGNRAFTADLAPSTDAETATLGIVVYDVSER